MYLLLQRAVRIPLLLLSGSQELSFDRLQQSWLKLGLTSFLISGLFSLVIVIARTPGIAEWINDPLFARKSLVLHVDLALVVVFYCFLAALYVTYSGIARPQRAHLGSRLVFIGILMMVSTVFVKSAEPILANYIPVLNHPLFVGGLFLVAAGLVSVFANNPFSIGRNMANYSKHGEPSSVPSASVVVRWAGLVVTMAMITFVMSAFITSANAHPVAYFEAVMWGGGHILQFANVLGMITVWLILAHRIIGSDPISAKTNLFLSSSLAVPAIISPILLMNGTADLIYHNGFTQLMRWFIFPVVTAYVILLSRHLWNARSKVSSTNKVYLYGFAVSVLLTLTGFTIGFMIRGSNTLVPAHYHASLGGITVAYMTMIYVFLESRGGSPKSKRMYQLRNVQPFLFGIGQTIFVIGFGYAGYTGMGRKLFGSDQSINSIDAMIGLSFMSLGGLLAMAGGLLFLYLTVKLFLQRTNPNHHG